MSSLEYPDPPQYLSREEFWAESDNFIRRFKSSYAHWFEVYVNALEMWKLTCLAYQQFNGTPLPPAPITSPNPPAPITSPNPPDDEPAQRPFSINSK